MPSDLRAFAESLAASRNRVNCAGAAKSLTGETEGDA